MMTFKNFTKPLFLSAIALSSSFAASGGETNPASPSQVLSGSQYYDSANTLETGTMANQGNWDMNTTPFPGSGYYSGLTSTVNSTQVCSGTEIFGSAGSAVCEVGSTSSPATAATILSGLEAWSATGAKITGTMANQGAFNAQNAFPGAAYYNGTVTNAPVASQLASGSTVLGVSGSNTGSFALNTGSNAPRDAGVAVVAQLAGQTTSSQITLSSETTTYGTTDLPTSGAYDYRDIPLANNDGDTYSGVSCRYAPRPTNDCGKTQATVALRIADCATQNPSTSTWNGATQCNRGQGTWNLVTRDGANEEVWQDARTGLLWSSVVSNSVNWCEASGNTQLAPVTFKQAYNGAAGTAMTGSGTIGSIQGGSSSLNETITITFSSATAFTVTSTGSGCSGGAQTGALTTTAGSTASWSRANYCSFTLTQGATNFAANDKIVLSSVAGATYSCYPGASSGLQPSSPMSYCAEADGAFTNYPTGENWASGTYLAAKGLMGANSVPSVRWRLPTIEDYEQANVDGFDSVLPDAGIAGSRRPTIDASTGNINLEWSATHLASSRNQVWLFGWGSGFVAPTTVSSLLPARCVGR